MNNKPELMANQFLRLQVKTFKFPAVFKYTKTELWMLFLSILLLKFLES